MRLFKAWSIIDKFLEQEQVRMDWFVVGRAEPLAPWDELIMDYDGEDDNAVYDQIMASELLNEVEVEQLTAYLEGKHQLAINVEPVELPMKSGGLSHGLRLISGAKGFYPLAEEPEYSLNISILGHYDCQVPETHEGLSSKDLEVGRKFLDCLASQCPDIGMDKWGDSQELLQKIYAATGLRVVLD